MCCICIFLSTITESKLVKACGKVSMDVGFSPYNIRPNFTLLLVEAVATKPGSNLVNASGLLFSEIRHELYCIHFLFLLWSCVKNQFSHK